MGNTKLLTYLLIKIQSVDLVHHISVIHAARKIIYCLWSVGENKIVLKKNTRNYTRFYELGGQVYFKQDSSSQWKGSAKVLGQDGPVLFFRHGGRYIKAHICRVQLTSHLRSEHSEIQDKQVKSENSQNKTENNIVNEIKSSSDEEDGNESDLYMLDTAVGNRKNHPYPTVVMKPN